MPSAEHESPVVLAKLDPGLLPWLLTNVFEMKVPEYHHAHTSAADVQVLVPRTYHADCMMVYCDQADEPRLAVVLEVQRGWDDTKRRTWKLYVAQLETEQKVDTTLLVYCPDRHVAERYRDMFEDGGFSSLPLRPWIFTPDDVPLVVDVERARRNPASAVLSAICHASRDEVDAAFPALAEALRALDPNRATLYYDVVLAGLPRVARSRWEDFMTTTLGYEYQSELFREIAAKGKAEGEVRGEVRAVLMVLESRGVPVPDDLRDQVLACTDRVLAETWLRRAVTASTIDEVLNG